MESAAIAAVAARAGARFVALRVVVDAAGDELPADVERWIDERGERRIGAALAAALRPAQWRGLWMLAQRYRVARRTLARLAPIVAGARCRLRRVGRARRRLLTLVSNFADSHR